MPEVFSTQEIVSAQSELIRGILSLLRGSGLPAQLLRLMLDGAKEHLRSGAYPQVDGENAARFVDVLAGHLPDVEPPPQIH